MRARFVVALLMLSLVTTAARAGSTAAKLTEMLGDSSDLLKAGKYAAALKLDDEVIRQMGEYYVSGDATTQLFCIAVVHKAIASAGLGKEDDALWYWHAAVSLYPPIGRSDMSAYGAAGKFLADHPPGRLSTLAPRGAEVKPPAVTKKVETKYPNQTLNAIVQGPVVIELMVGRDGRAHTPRVVDAMGAPILAFATLEALRQWQFSPATADGQPIDAAYRITMNYKVLH